MYRKLLLTLIAGLLPLALFAQTPTLADENLSIRAVTASPFESVRLSFSHHDSTLYLLTRTGDIYSVNIAAGSLTKVQSGSDHGLSDVQGFDISGDGHFYIVGNSRNNQNYTNTGIIKKGKDTGNDWEWVTVAETEAYPLSNTYFDHIMNGIVVSPDNEFLYINSGSRTDHGEEHTVEGRYPGLREAPLTAKILRVPADTVNLLLENDSTFLHSNGYVFADGTRNSFSLAFDGQGKLFATENAGERDDPGELNWLREGHHYGFPWTVGGNITPMQFDGYDPDQDIMLQPETSGYQFGYFYNDPDYPAPPEDVTFTEPILNHGPDADSYRDHITGEIMDASEQDTAISSFTAHRSMLGLSIDTENYFAGEYEGDLFALAFSGADDNSFFIRWMDDPGEDLVHMELSEVDGNYEMSVTTIAYGFISPIDTEIIANKMYVVEHKNNSWLNNDKTTRIWEITFPGTGTANESPETDFAGNFKLHQNYPNPFNPSTMISYQLSVNSEVTLKVFDMLGREVATLVDGQVSAGTHDVMFDAFGLPSGIYFYRLQVSGNDNFGETRKMLLLK